MKALILFGTMGIVVLVVTVLYTYIYNEPDRVFEEIRTSIQDGDRVTELVSLDIAEIKEKTRLRLEDRLRERVFLDIGGESCREIADLLGAGLITKQLDDFLSLDNIEKLLSTKEENESKKTTLPLGRYINLSTYKITLSTGDTTNRRKLSVVMKRIGIGSWIVNDIEVPIDNAILDKIGLESAMMSESLENLCSPKIQKKYTTEILPDMKKPKAIQKTNKQPTSIPTATETKRSNRACEIERDLRSKGINIPVIGCKR
jgi:hypothetical protein